MEAPLNYLFQGFDSPLPPGVCAAFELHLHGSAFEFNQNNGLKANPFFLPAGQQSPKYIDNQLGGTLGGPIIKNRLFYFVSYDGQFIRQNANTFAAIPTAAIRSAI